MSDHNDNNKSFNLPAYINIPLFLYKDDLLEKSSLLLGAFFYSLYTAGKSITASKDYLCELLGIGKTQYFNTLKQLECLGYIKRTGFTNRKKIEWVYCTKSSIIVDESNTSPVNRTTVKLLNTSSDVRTKLVRDPELNLSGSPDTYNKEDTKEYKKLTTVNPKPSSSSFFSEKQTIELLSYKIKSDSRTNELFLENCQVHIEKQTNDLSKFQRFTGLKHILNKLNDSQECFKASGLEKESALKQQDNRIPTQEDFNNYKRCINGYEWVGSWMQRQKSA